MRHHPCENLKRGEQVDLWQLKLLTCINVCKAGPWESWRRLPRGRGNPARRVRPGLSRAERGAAPPGTARSRLLPCSGNSSSSTVILICLNWNIFSTIVFLGCLFFFFFSWWGGESVVFSTFLPLFPFSISYPYMLFGGVFCWFVRVFFTFLRDEALRYRLTKNYFHYVSY